MMTDTEKLTLLLKVLKDYAEMKHCYDDNEYYHADFPDYPPEMIFDDGIDYGEIHLARTLLEQIGEKFEYPCMSEEE
jgi:hypothetical protein